MANITAKNIQDLRSSTGAGMMDCKAALTESDGNLEDAVTWLRKKGLAKAAKKSGRTACEGLVSLKTSDDKKQAVIIECNCETDFVSRNEIFQQLTKQIADLALANNGDYDAIKNANFPGSDKNVQEHLAEMVGKIGENLQFRRSFSLNVNNGVVASYIHGATNDLSGRLIVIVSLNSDTDKTDKLYDFGRKLAMHIAAAHPISLSRNDMDQSLVTKEKELFTDQLKNSGKPAEIVTKMIEGRMRKFFEESTLLEQTYVIDGKIKVSDALMNMEKELGTKITIDAFYRIALGEGLEKKEENLADEVKALNKS